MTTPSTMNSIIASLKARLADAENRRLEAKGVENIMFFEGYSTALSDTLQEITGD